ncbi:MAG TPA: tRNA (adenosine(37)-N6)-dimethylallyltransferase MiaA [Bacteroidetes bacterium]|nr:tRNA dimethylallyltransferase [bacterium BMS3Bbin04]HDO66064.1 tRNA (adenosine(37)-N6)-dimethylallyltransferase MiaA [Bacteroidota bacterium]HEX05189.1 tRNA (adenosine(37)-N6)-dimethylallyltransferase MiaA [Bacteroidota bacterium]
MRKLDQTVLILVGPTASGKTEVAVQLAHQLNGEIISADSRQIYRFMDIGTATPNLSERRGIPHYGFDILNPDESFSAGRFAAMARKWVEEIHGHGKCAIIAGGSGLYLKGLIDGFYSGEEIKDEEIRHRLNQRANNLGIHALYEELQKIDPDYCEIIVPTDRQRILRALEVIEVTGKPFSLLHQKKRDNAPWNALWFGMELPRELLYDRINLRVTRMLDMGLLAEVRDLLDRGFENTYTMKSVGYEESAAYLRGEIGSIDEMIALIQKNTRQYAKRQLTWFRPNERIQWVNAEKKSAVQVAEQIRLVYTTS